MRDSKATPHFFAPHYPAGVLRFFRSLITERVHRFFYSPLFQGGRGSPLSGTDRKKSRAILLSDGGFKIHHTFIIQIPVKMIPQNTQTLLEKFVSSFAYYKNASGVISTGGGIEGRSLGRPSALSLYQDMGGVASAMPEMPRRNAGRWKILPILRYSAGPGAA